MFFGDQDRSCELLLFLRCSLSALGVSSNALRSAGLFLGALAPPPPLPLPARDIWDGGVRGGETLCEDACLSSDERGVVGFCIELVGTVSLFAMAHKRGSVWRRGRASH